MYKYKSICRFKMLIFVDHSILEIRPNQIITRNTPLEHELLREIKKSNKKPKVVQYKKKRRKTELPQIPSPPPLSNLTIVSSNDNSH